MDRYRQTTRGRAHQLFHNAKSRAHKGGQDFTITPAWIEERLIVGVCEVTGAAFELDFKSARAPSLDQKEPGQGYTPENTRVVTWFYNRAKGTSTDDDTTTLILQAAEALLGRRTTKEPIWKP